MGYRSAITSLLVLSPWVGPEIVLGQDGQRVEGRIEPKVCLVANSDRPSALLQSELSSLSTLRSVDVSSGIVPIAVATDDSDAPSECKDILLSDPGVPSKLPSASQYDILSLRFSNSGKPLSLRAAKLTSPVITRKQGGPDEPHPVADEDLDKLEAQFLFAGLSAMDENDIGEVQFTFSVNDGQTVTLKRYLRGSTGLRVNACIMRRGEKDCDPKLTGLTRAIGYRTPSANWRDFIIVRLRARGRDLTKIEAKLVEFRLSIGGKPIDAFPAADFDETLRAFHIPLYEVREKPHAQQVELEVVTEGKSEQLSFRVRKRSDSYGMAGIWLPVGLLATDFKATKDRGIALAPSPVGVALGRRVYTGTKENSYLGLSAFGSWQILPGNEDEKYLTGLTLGGILDVADWGYVGGSYVSNLGKAAEDPGFAVILGPGPTLIRVFKLLSGD